MQSLMTKDIIWRVALALAGCIAFEELIGGGALGWSVGGVILAVTCYPLLKRLLEYR
ncbi:hypothetical protein AAIH46_04650 [Rhizobium sp. 0TCS1.26]|uniref:hypothetical protein n=1 Tax=Rhizobium sp. 0TCS1.26 TaxID=3142623 RepID=UPI003D2DA077